METIADKIRKAGRKRIAFRARDIAGVRDPRSTLRRMVRMGELVQAGRGLYRLPGGEWSVSHTLAEAALRYPGCVICLVSALAFHGIGTQVPHETWLMRRDRKAPPRGEAVRFVYSTGPGFAYGVEEHVIDGVTVRVYGPAKTVADCFKYRNKIGLDVALEALREGWRGKRFTMDELWAAAKVCRVQSVMQPYIEMLVQ